VLALLTYENKHVALVHPVTHVAASFCDDILSPFLSRHAIGLFDQYSVVVSRPKHQIPTRVRRHQLLRPLRV
jgi:hypothetical protein